ncbi:hypothetical protein EST38_g3387 [Candolleomyces aberdarensis]|uniref:thioredoxin-dependent peroxiredoxin n=1 Tax=Candolleomyces aberdarensis TaxID=2316362 RepID=A0A4Q2DQX1_9AGAR|nr:hypothetical protein EST38_g3387 [Candolleomyces aberdarensis]
MTGFEHLIGKPAPSFTLPNYDGEPFEFKPGASGLPTALLFYPQSGSYGCTQQICSFRDAVIEKTTFKPEKSQVIAISPDPVEKQKEFVEKQNLPFPVLSDTEKEVPKLYGIGKGFFGFAPIARVTFIVDKDGIIRDALDATMNYNAHQKFVDKWFQKLDGESATTES